VSLVLAWIGAIGGLIGALGGMAGFLAYSDQRDSRRRADSIAHIPREMEPVLAEILDNCLYLERKPEEPTYASARFCGVQQDWEPLSHRAITAGRGDAVEFARISVLMDRFSQGLDPDGFPRGDEPQQTRGEQRETVRQLGDAANAMLHRLHGVDAPAPPSDGSDVPPRPLKARGLRRFLPD
jgi:hypothetical protein